MAEQSFSEQPPKPKESALPFYKRAAKKLAPLAVAVSLLSPSDGAPPIPQTLTSSPTPPTEITEMAKTPDTPLSTLESPTETKVQQPDELQEDQQEKEKVPFAPKVTIIDTGLSAPREGIIQKEFFQNDELAKKVLGDTYLSKEQLEQEFGRPIDWAFSPDVAEAAEATKKYPQILLHKFADTRLGHGETVTRVMEKTWNSLGLQSTGVEIIPLQTIFDTASIKETKDALGNKGISISFDPKRIIDLLRNDTNRVVNMSFQVGDIELLIEKRRKVMPEAESTPTLESLAMFDEKDNAYIGAVYTMNDATTYIDAEGKEVKPATPEELRVLKQTLKEREKEAAEKAEKNARIVELEHPDIKIIGAYDRTKARENLPKLFEVARAYPDKLFFAAAGNEGEDLREALKELGDEKPPNLSFVAQWTAGFKPTHNVYGANIYVPNSNLGAPDGSSFSTPIMAAYAETLFKQGLSMQEVMKKIINTCVTRQYNADNEEQAFVLDPDLLPKLDASYWKDQDRVDTIIKELR